MIRVIDWIVINKAKKCFGDLRIKLSDIISKNFNTTQQKANNAVEITAAALNLAPVSEPAADSIDAILMSHDEYFPADGTETSDDYFDISFEASDHLEEFAPVGTYIILSELENYFQFDQASIFALLLVSLHFPPLLLLLFLFLSFSFSPSPSLSLLLFLSFSFPFSFSSLFPSLSPPPLPSFSYNL